MWRGSLLVALALLSGCVGEPSQAPAEGVAATPERLSVAGSEEATGPLVAGEPVILDVDGFATTWFCAPSGLNSCVGYDVPTEALGPSSVRIERDDVVFWHVDLEVAWDATTEVTESLLLYAGPYLTCPGTDCIQVIDGALSTTSVSPLRLAGDTLPRDSKADGFVIGVQSDKAWPVGVGGYSTGQSFKLRATLTPFVPA